MVCLAASAALAVSDIPIKEIISEVRVGRVNGQLKINPTRAEMEQSNVDFIVAATARNLMMVEGEAKECSEEELADVLQVAHDAMRIQVKAQEELRDLKGVTSKREYTKPESDPALEEKVYSFAKQKVYEIANGKFSKHDRRDKFSVVRDELMENLKQGLAEGEELPELTKKL